MSSSLFGFSLLEVLISLFIFSIILLGFDAMEINALRSSRAAYYSSVAIIQVQSMAEKLHATGDASSWLTRWNQQNKALLPKGRGDLLGAYPIFEIQLHWFDSKKENTIIQKVMV